MGFLDFLLQPDIHLQLIISEYGVWIYALLFIIIFCETGLVVTPFLPGDSLLITAGSVAAVGDLNLPVMILLLFMAAFLGDTVNYFVENRVGERVLKHHTRWLKKEHLKRTRLFYQRHGGKTIFLARFIPIIRTFAPFVAGIGIMNYPYFLIFNIAGGLTWVLFFSMAGYFLGNQSYLKAHFGIMVLLTIALSMVPVAIQWIKEVNLSKRI